MPDDRSQPLPIIEELGAALYAAAGRRRRFPRGFPTRRARWLPVLAFVLVGASATMGGLAAAGTLSGGTIDPQAWVNGQRVVPEPRMTADQTQLAILRRPRTDTDALDAYDSQVFTNSPAAANGINVDLSRRAHGITSGAAWVIPGNAGNICLVAENAAAVEMNNEPGPWQQHTRVYGATGATNCTTIAAMDAGWFAGYAGSSETPGRFFTGGIVPDGVSEVTVALSDGSTATESVHDNTWMGLVSGAPQSVSFTRPTGATGPTGN